MQLLREVGFMLETLHYFVGISLEFSELIFGLGRPMQLFLSDIVPSSLINSQLHPLVFYILLNSSVLTKNC